MTLHSSRAETVEFNLGFPRLYREELEEIARILREECESDLLIDFHDERGRTGTEPADFTHYAENHDSPEVLQRLTMSGARGTTRMLLEFSRSGNKLVITTPDNSSRGAAGQIREICRANRRLTWRTHPPDDTWGVPLATLASMTTAASGAAAASRLFGDQAEEMPVMVGVVVAILFAVTAVVIGGNVAARPLLINMPRSERPSLWQRHRRDSVTLVLGGVIGYLGSHIPSPWNLIS
ncbi:hypothetical protein ACFQZ2_08330 [Streptomonospora algeriensis]|uniref:Uncharacterized protein n=1 Tax=Streptomonospora algeriensis TaxID=995084 RepID=A0ABW3BHB8_9ACTN